ncbi:hypothetical protein AB0N33_16740 [Pseudarthrobacter oxydans]
MGSVEDFGSGLEGPSCGDGSCVDRVVAQPVQETGNGDFGVVMVAGQG